MPGVKGNFLTMRALNNRSSLGWLLHCDILMSALEGLLKDIAPYKGKPSQSPVAFTRQKDKLDNGTASFHL